MENTVLLSREQVLEALDLEFEVVDVPEWGGKVRVKGLTGQERDWFESSLIITTGKIQKVDTQNIRAKLCAMCMVDNDGSRLFSDQDVALLGRKSAAALDRVYEVASRLSKISKEDVEELAGNSGSVRSVDS